MAAITDFMTTDEIMLELGRRLKGRRLSRNVLAEQTAEQIGLNRKTIYDIEAGKDARVSSLIKLLRGLGALGALDAAVPEILPSGEGLSSRGQPRLKASAGKKHGKTT